MSNNITTLVLNLLISENLQHRLRLADKITELLESAIGDFGQIETAMRGHFLSRLQSCVENPTGNSREALFDLADFYKEHYVGTVVELAIAA